MKSNNKNTKKGLFRSIAMLCLLLINISVICAQTNKIPYGSWEVSQVTIEKKTNGKMAKNVYATAAEVKENIPCPQTWEIKNSNTVVLHYSGDSKDTTEYTLKDGQLMMSVIGVFLKYQYNTNGETLTLTLTQNYKWHQSEGLIDDIEEKRIITLNLKK